MLRQIPVKLPWSFEDALGYPRGFRWVAFFWEPCGDEAMFGQTEKKTMPGNEMRKEVNHV